MKRRWSEVPGVCDACDQAVESVVIVDDDRLCGACARRRHGCQGVKTIVLVVVMAVPTLTKHVTGISAGSAIVFGAMATMLVATVMGFFEGR